MVAASLIGIVAAMLLVRAGWGGLRGAAMAGWTVAAAALLVLAGLHGAWGLAMGVVAGSAVAIGCVLQAGWTAPAKSRRPARGAPAIALPRRVDDLGRRLAVFVLVVPVAFAAAQWFAFAVGAMARRYGVPDADATVVTLFGQPLLWAGLMTWQMTCARPARMVVAPLGAAVAGTVLWSLA